MYEDLVERLRSVKDSWQTEKEDLMLEAADTIEYLSSYFETASGFGSRWQTLHGERARPYYRRGELHEYK